ncbi:hypothetical protein EYF80_024933 [Liparis tanakae]|uniref:Uncharacterized protein n=1 Tax=Liparis tanakae TaxID=230148 RepID=A0A4Z2HJ09_9TELE|nr:hypothetical protein EYF80_024933 [Liparis tanakae]
MVRRGKSSCVLTRIKSPELMGCCRSGVSISPVLVAAVNEGLFGRRTPAARLFKSFRQSGAPGEIGAARCPQEHGYHGRLSHVDTVQLTCRHMPKYGKFLRSPPKFTTEDHVITKTCYRYEKPT